MRLAVYAFALFVFGAAVVGCSGTQSLRSGGTLPPYVPGSNDEANPQALHPFLPLAITNQSSIDIFDAGRLGKGIVASIPGIPVPKTAIYDKQGNLYVATENFVNVYNKKIHLQRSVTYGISGAVALALDSMNDLYVVNQANNTITVYPPGGSTPTRTINGLNVPAALALDSAGNLYVLNKGVVGPMTGSISVYPPGGSSPKTITDGIDVPAALIIGRRNTLYVANSGNNTVSEYALGGTAPARTITNVTYPSALALDKQDNLYVANESGRVVTVYKPGKTVAARTLTHVDRPNGIAIDQSSNVFVSTFGKKLVEFGASSAPSEPPTKVVDLGISAQPIAANIAFGTTGSPPGGALPQQTASPQQLFAVDTSGSRILAFNLPLGPTPSPAQTISSGLSNPNLLAFDSFGNLFTDNQYFGHATVLEFTPPYSGPPSNSVPLQTPQQNLILEQLQFDQQNDLFVSNCYYGVVAVIPPPYTATLALITQGLVNARALGFTPRGDLLVANWCEPSSGGDGSIKDYRAPFSSASSPSASLGTGSWPQPIIVDPQGNVYVVYNPSSGSYINIYSPPYGSGSVTTITTGLNGADALLLDLSGNLYVANSAGTGGSSTGSVSIYTPPFTSSSSPSATITSQMDGPSWLAMSSAGNLYVLNKPPGGGSLHNYVLEFTPPFTSSSSPSGSAGGLSGPAYQQIAIPPASGSGSGVGAWRPI